MQEVVSCFSSQIFRPNWPLFNVRDDRRVISTPLERVVASVATLKPKTPRFQPESHCSWWFLQLDLAALATTCLMPLNPLGKMQTNLWSSRLLIKRRVVLLPLRLGKTRMWDDNQHINHLGIKCRAWDVVPALARPRWVDLLLLRRIWDQKTSTRFWLCQRYMVIKRYYLHPQSNRRRSWCILMIHKTP